MLPKQNKPKPSKYSKLYDILIPQDHELRKLIQLVDFSFVYDELSSKYSIDMGRAAVDPVQMFKYLFLKIRYNLSDRDLIERAKTDMAMKFFIGLNPEDDVIHPSLLSKFRRQRLKDVNLLKVLIKKTVEIAIQQDVLQKETVIVDATHTVARYNQKSPIETLRQASKILRKRIYEIDPSMKDQFPAKNTKSDLALEQEYTDKLLSTIEKYPKIIRQIKISEAFNNLNELQGDVKEYEKYSKDNDAKVGHKDKDSSFFGYKTHLAMSENRIITAAVITGGEKGDGQYLERLVSDSNENGMNVKEIIGDHAYSGKLNIQYANENNFSLISRLTPVITNGFRKPEDLWDYNKDAGMFVCPNGQMAIRKARQGRKSLNQTMTYYFDIQKCQNCPLRDGCYKPGAKSKTYNITLKSNEHTNQMEFENTEYFNNRVKQRYEIEAKNAELKTKHGYDKSWSSGITSMTLQGAITLFCVNIKRITKLINEK
ncbi:IS1182 family transposase [Companilactobacillus futsaii]|uniref:IS1182 family transposase n=1 Tax=Companilactobacillus futsaii TaxID=938155 RepID=A0A5B7SYI3_9LACO|nr:IS1182 family transposase [Companilactobacillus futsaii]QCX24857.1 IS1182 family transposase [Companilactobacillus futsaii]